MGLLNPWVLLGLVVAFAAAGFQGYRMGSAGVRAEWAAATMKEQTLAEKIRAGIRDEGQKLSTDLETSIGKIKVENRTVVKNITREKEIHHVLTDVNCAYPESTVRLLNAARRGPNAPRSASGEPARPLPAAGAAPGK